MRNRCGRASGAPASELIGPRLGTVEDAVAAIRMSAGDLDQESIVVLVCDDEKGVFTIAEAEAIEELVASCLVDEACLRDMVVITGDRWRSVSEVVINGCGENNGYQ